MSDFLLERYSGNPYVIATLAADLGLDQEIWEIFQESFDDLPELRRQIEDYRFRNIPQSDLDAIHSEIKGILEIETELGANFIINYLNEIHNRMPELSANYIDRLAFQEYSLKILESTDPLHHRHVKFFRLNWKQERHHVKGGHLCLLPFIDLEYNFIRPLIEQPNIEEHLIEILTDDDPLPLTVVSDTLSNRQIYIDLDYLEFVLLNSPKFLLVDLDEPSVDLADEIFQGFELAAWGINPESYVKTSGLTYYDGRSLSNFDLDVNAEPLIKFFGQRGEEKFMSGVNWEEVAVKLKLIRKSQIGKIQGLPVPVHREIVRCLTQRQRAMSVSDLKKSLGLNDIPLTPENLPPGKIMAYAPGPRFLKRGDTLFILRDWVQDEANWKKRISITRVVTPLKSKATDFTDNQFQQCLNEDVALSKYGVVSGKTLTEAIARKLPEIPTDIYHLGLIRQEVEQRLSERLTHIGKGLYIDDRHIGIVDRFPGLTRKRRAIAMKILGADSNLSSHLDEIEQSARDTVRELL